MGVDPISMGVMAAGTIASGAIKAGSSLAAGQAAQDAANYRAIVAHNNSILDEQQAKWTEEAGQARESAQGMKNRQTVGGIKTSQAASGVDVDSGSSSQVRDAASALGVLDQMTIRSDTSREAYGYRVKAGSDEAESQLDIMQGNEAKRASKVQAITSLLDSASSVGGKYAAFQRGATGAGSGI